VFPLAFLAVVVVLFGGGIWFRRRCGLAVTSAFRSDLALLSAGFGTTFVGTLIPTYVIVHRGLYGGSIADNLPGGVSEDTLLNLVIVGGVITIVAGANRYLDRIKTE
jgi:hypothetical protein